MKFNNNLIRESSNLVLLNQYVKTVAPDKRPLYNYLLKKHKDNINIAHKTVNDNRIKLSKNKSKTTWEIIREHSNFKPQSNNKIKNIVKNNINITDLNEISNDCNEYFVSTVQNYVENNFPDKVDIDFKQDFTTNLEEKFVIPLSTPDSLIKVIDKLPNKNTAGPDNVTYKIAKEFKDDADASV